MGFQTVVNRFQAPGVEGDFASANPRATVLTTPGGLVAGAEGVIIGRFAWVAEDGKTVNNFADGSGPPDGFVHRDQQGLITTYLADSSMVIPPGFAVTLHNEGDFLVVNRGANPSFNGEEVFADYSDGTAVFGAAPTGASVTGSIGATFTATGAAEVLTVTALTGYLSIGDTIAGTGVPAGTVITGQTAGTKGAAGTYTTSNPTTSAAATLTGFGDVLNVTAVGSGTLELGDAISGTNVPTGSTIIGNSATNPVLTGNGGVGTYQISAPATQYVAGETVTVGSGVLTSWVAKTVGAEGEIVKISTWGN